MTSRDKRLLAVAAWVSSLAITAGIMVLAAGLDYSHPLLVVAGTACLAAGAVSSALVIWISAELFLAAGGEACLVWQVRGRRVVHRHWPSRKIVSCRSTTGFHRHRPRS